MANSNNDRRRFIRNAAIGGLMAAGIPEILSAADFTSKKGGISPGKETVILFQGDSITDAGRDKSISEPNDLGAMGFGYVLLAGASLLEKYPPSLKIYNRGISGNKVFQLAERWDQDCLQIKPGILSILIGVNDIWHKLEGYYNEGTVEVYRNDYDALVQRTKSALPEVKLIICEPFAVPGVKAVDDRWYPEFYGYQKAAREIADKYDAVFIPLQKIFDEACKRAPGSYWTPDGVHPSLAGAQLMAAAWIEAVKLIIKAS